MNDAQSMAWYKQFWPWFIVVLLGAAVTASLVTVWIAFAAAPERVDGAGLLAVPVEISANQEILTFDLGLAPPGESWPEHLRVTLVSRPDGRTQQMRAERIDERRYKTPVKVLEPGAHEVMLQAETLTLRGSWAYPAPVWKLERDE
ncbi:MAG: FixH family protein [Gammaproteobacteria bacterium]|nr:FixH family protein [Gammaproteobacteria bacterium]